MNHETLFFSLLILFILCVGLFMYLVQYAYSGKNKLSPSQAIQMLKSGELNHIVDVRSNIEWNIGHHPTAINIPVSQINEDTLRVFQKNDGILVYCNTGQRARYASEKIKSYGFENVYYIATTFHSIMPNDVSTKQD